ncbi:hypothetical protein LTR94_026422, partial [Friedmanniomyces endolithicus]
MHIAYGLTAAMVLLSGTVAAFAQPAPVRSVALTFDDLPYVGGIGDADGQLSRANVLALNRRILDGLREAGAPATGFVVERSVEAMGEDGRLLLVLWTEGDFDLGNHGYSHAEVNGLDLVGIEQEVLRGEASAREAMTAAGKSLQFMRFPQNHTGETAEKRNGIRAILDRFGYQAAASTIDTSDYVFETAYQVALRRGRTDCQALIRDAYVAYSAVQIDYYTALSVEVLGYAPPEVALLHLNQLNADTLPRLLELYRDRGFAFTSLAQAQADPAYLRGSNFVSRYGPMWAYRWAREYAVRVDGSKETEPPAWVSTYA